MRVYPKNHVYKKLFHLMRTNQEKRKKEETDPQLREFMNNFSAKDAVLEQGIGKIFEQSV